MNVHCGFLIHPVYNLKLYRQESYPAIPILTSCWNFIHSRPTDGAVLRLQSLPTDGTVLRLQSLPTDGAVLRLQSLPTHGAVLRLQSLPTDGAVLRLQSLPTDGAVLRLQSLPTDVAVLRLQTLPTWRRSRPRHHYIASPRPTIKVNKQTNKQKNTHKKKKNRGIIEALWSKLNEWKVTGTQVEEQIVSIWMQVWANPCCVVWRPKCI